MASEDYIECRMVKVSIYRENGVNGPVIGIAIAISPVYDIVKQRAIQALKRYLPIEECECPIDVALETNMRFPPVTKLVFLWTEKAGLIK